MDNLLLHDFLQRILEQRHHYYNMSIFLFLYIHYDIYIHLEIYRYTIFHINYLVFHYLDLVHHDSNIILIYLSKEFHYEYLLYILGHPTFLHNMSNIQAMFHYMNQIDINLDDIYMVFFFHYPFAQILYYIHD